jgi:hypothetical protein
MRSIYSALPSPPVGSVREHLTDTIWDQCIMDLKIGTYGAGWVQFGEWDGSTPIVQNDTYVIHSLWSSPLLIGQRCLAVVNVITWGDTFA